jgi:hypothetical protein
MEKEKVTVIFKGRGKEVFLLEESNPRYPYAVYEVRNGNHTRYDAYFDLERALTEAKNLFYKKVR